MKHIFCLFAVILLFAGVAANATTYQVKELQILPGGTYTRGFAINNSGQMVGSSSIAPKTKDAVGAPEEHAVLWTPEGVVKDLGTLSGVGGSWANAINDAGVVVGYSDLKTKNTWFDRHAVIWDKDGKIKDLGTLGGARSDANAINNCNQVVGWSYLSGSARHAFLWSAEKGMVDLGTLPGDDESWASDINDAGQIVGWSSKGSTSHQHAVLWEHDGKIKDLGLMIGIESLKVHDINNLGQIAGSRISKNRETDGIIWSASKGISYTGRLTSPAKFPGSIFPEPVAGSSVSAINNHRQAVGSSNGDRTVCRAFVWSPSAGLSELPMLPKSEKAGTKIGHRLALSARLKPMFEATRASSASDINDHGVIIGSSNSKSVVWRPIDK